MPEKTLLMPILSTAKYLRDTGVRVTYRNPERGLCDFPRTISDMRTGLVGSGISLPMVYRQLGEIINLQSYGRLPYNSTIDISDVNIKPGRLIATVGGQGGDEGKGKIADVLVTESSLIARVTGGNNARYTFVVNGQEYQLRHLPLGIVDPSKTCIIGPGTFNDPAELIWEIFSLQSRGIAVEPGNLRVSRQAQTIFPIHRLRGRVEEAHNERGGKKIASTSKGVGPAASDAAGKRGITFNDLLEDYYSNGFDPDFRFKFESLASSEQAAMAGTKVNGIGISEQAMDSIKERTYGEELIKLLSVLLIHPEFELTNTQQTIIRNLIEEGQTEAARKGAPGKWQEMITAAMPVVFEILGRNISMDQMFYDSETNGFLSRINMHMLYKYLDANTPRLIEDALDRGETVLLQGVQGTLISRTAGVYPFTAGVDSVIASSLVGAGVGYPISEAFGVIKAYQTLSGGGMMPFPTQIREGEELSTAQLNAIRTLGGEFGVTIGARRMGWLDAPMLKYSAMVNGLTSWGITHLDAFTGIDRIKLCVNYEYQRHGQTVSMGIDKYNPNPNFLTRVNPVYIEMPGWTEDISETRSFEELPLQAQLYLQKVAELTGVPISIVSVGPRREQTFCQMIFPSGNVGLPWR